MFPFSIYLMTKCRFGNSKISEMSVHCLLYMIAKVLYQQC